nr:2Fe-2S iron-sulfur cluster-binding protein [Bordetella pertussis]
MLAATRDFTLEVNASRHTVTADPDTPLLYILRNDLCLNGPKFGCGLGECGACAVLIDGVAARACTIPVRGCGTHIEIMAAVRRAARLWAARQA